MTTASTISKQAEPRVGLTTKSQTARGRRRLTPARAVLHIVVVIVSILWFTPILQFVAVALRTTPDSSASGWWQIFLHPLLTVDNFSSGADVLQLGSSLPSTLAIAVPAVVLVIVLSAIGGYVFAVFEFRGRFVAYAVLVAMLAVPPQVAFTPLITLFSALHLSGSVAAVWIFQAGYTIPFGIFLVRGFLQTVPRDLIEAARVDGASELRTFLQVVTPLTAPILAALGILQFMWSWNDLLTPLIFMGTASSTAPITLQLAGLVQSQTNQINVLAASSLIAIVPPLLILLVLQRYFVAGITGGAVKG